MRIRQDGRTRARQFLETQHSKAMEPRQKSREFTSHRPLHDRSAARLMRLTGSGQMRPKSDGGKQARGWESKRAAFMIMRDASGRRAPGAFVNADVRPWPSGVTSTRSGHRRARFAWRPGVTRVNVAWCRAAKARLTLGRVLETGAPHRFRRVSGTGLAKAVSRRESAWKNAATRTNRA